MKLHAKAFHLLCRPGLSVPRASITRSFTTSQPVLTDELTRLRSSPPLYFHSPTSSFSLVKPSISASKLETVPLGTTSEPLSAFVKSLPHGDTDSYGESSGEMGFTTFELYPIPQPSNFHDNSSFIKNVLFPVLSKHVHECPEYNRIAEGEKFYGGTTLHVYDFRAPPPYGRIPDVQDILGTVRIQEAEFYDEDSPERLAGQLYKTTPIVPGTFEPNPMYRLLTMNGFIHLSDLLQKKVARACQS